MMTSISQGEVIKDGWLTKKAMKSGRNWRKRFFVLKKNAMIYYDELPNLANDKSSKPKGLVEITENSVVRAAPVARKFAFELVTKPQVLCVQADSQQDLDDWQGALNHVIESLKKSRNSLGNETRRGWLVKRAVRSQKNWKKRFFILQNGRLKYYEQIPSGPADRPNGIIDIEPTSIVKETIANVKQTGKKHAFFVENSQRTIHLSASSLDERDAWISVIHLAVLRQNDIVKESAVRVGIWMHKIGLQRYVAPVIKIVGLDTFEKIKNLSDDRLKEVLQFANFSLNDARRFQLAIRELQSMRPLELENLGRYTLTGDMPEPLETLPPEEPKSVVKALRLSLSRRLSRKSKQGVLSADGKTHILEKRLFTWGDDSKFQLGIGSSTPGMTSQPSHLLALRNKTEPGIIVAGRDCMAAITADEGKLYTWGSGPTLGLGPNRPVSNRPFIVAALQSTVVVHVSLSEAHAAAVTSSGEVFTWGLGASGQLGHGEHCKETLTPLQVKDLSAVHMESVYCSTNHTLFLDKDGGIYSCGNGKHGKLGFNNETTLFTPDRIDSLSGHVIGQVAVGDDFSIAVSKNGFDCFWWGMLGGIQGPLAPVRMQSFDPRPINSVVAAGDMAMFLVGVEKESDDAVSTSSVYTVGNSGILMCLGDSKPRQVPTLVTTLNGHGVVQISCSQTHAGAICEDGQLLMWGEDSFGQLGSGYHVSVGRPHLSITIAGYKYTKLSCGVGSTAAIGEYDPAYKGTDAESSKPYGSIVLPPPPAEVADADETNQENIAKQVMILHTLSQAIAGNTRKESDEENLDDEDESDLPPGSREYCDGWLEHTDPRSGKLFYEEIATGKVMWDAPQNV